MKLIYTEQNQIGAYPPIQTVGSSTVIPPGMALWPEDLTTDTFFNHNGFVTLVVEDVDGIPTVTGCEPNTEAWEAWKAGLPEEPEDPPDPSPSLEQRVSALEETLKAPPAASVGSDDVWAEMAAAYREGVQSA